MVNLRLSSLGIIGGTLLAVGTLAWWSLQPGYPGLCSGAPSAPRSTSIALELNRQSESRTGSSEPSGFAEATTPKLSAEVPGEAVLLERRCLQLAERDPRAALNLAIDTSPLSPPPGLLENLTAQWATHDLQASHQWVLQQQPSPCRDGLLARVAFVGAQSDPAAAALIVSDEMAPGEKQAEAAISVVHQWAIRDLAGASAWANAFPEGALRQRAIDEIEGVRKGQPTGGQ